MLHRRPGQPAREDMGGVPHDSNAWRQTLIPSFPALRKRTGRSVVSGSDAPSTALVGCAPHFTVPHDSLHFVIVQGHWLKKTSCAVHRLESPANTTSTPCKLLRCIRRGDSCDGTRFVLGAYMPADIFLFFPDEPFCKHPGAVPVQQTTGVNQTNDQTPNHPEHGGKLTPCGR